MDLAQTQLRYSHHYGIVRIYDDKKCWGIICDILPVRDRTDGVPRTVYGNDYFVHRSALRPRVPEQCSEPRLHTGEYVEFTVDTTQPVDAQRLRRVFSVSGVFGGTLLCEHANVVFKSYTHLNRSLFPPTRTLRAHATATVPTVATRPPLSAGATALPPPVGVAAAAPCPMAFPQPASGAWPPPAAAEVGELRDNHAPVDATAAALLAAAVGSAPLDAQDTDGMVA